MMEPVGIDVLRFSTTSFCLTLDELAKARGVDVAQFHRTTGQESMSIPAPDQDIVTMGTEAAQAVLQHCSPSEIGMLLLATETGVDQATAGGVFIHQLLGLPAQCRVVEYKQACYSGTAALTTALDWVKLNPNKKVLVIASDIARYATKSSGEPTQGAGAIAMLVSTHPRTLVLKSHNAFYTQQVMDFWRPNYSDVPIFNGRRSVSAYLECLKATWNLYTASTGLQLEDHAGFCFHTPFVKMPERALRTLYKWAKNEVDPIHLKRLHHSNTYAKLLGNTYTASLYIGLVCLLESDADLSNKRIGLFSYGSGYVGEFLEAIIQPEYQSQVARDFHQDLIAHRKHLDYTQYLQWVDERKAAEQEEGMIPNYGDYQVRHSENRQHQRIYTIAQ